jgi:hypothetical protein
MKLVTFTKLDGQPAVINVDYVVVLFPSEGGSRIVLSNGIDIYVKLPLEEVQRLLDEQSAA